MAKAPNGVETLPKISMAGVGPTNVTDDSIIANVNVFKNFKRIHHHYS